MTKAKTKAKLTKKKPTHKRAGKQAPAAKTLHVYRELMTAAELGITCVTAPGGAIYDRPVL